MESKINTNEEINILVIGGGQRFIDVYTEGLKKIIQKYPNIHCYFASPNFEEEIKKLQDIKIHILCSFPFNTQSLKSYLKAFPTIKWFHSLSAGIEKYFEVEELVNNDNIIFTNNKGAYSESFGEAGIASMIYFSYHISSYIENMKEKKWVRPTNKMLGGKKLLIIGYGNNGLCLARQAKMGFNMKVIGAVRTMRENIPGKEYTEEIYALKELPDQVINEADFIYVTLPATPETNNIFDKKFFAKMNKEAVFINVGRGNCVIEEDIYEALEKDIIRGAVLDVTQKEPLDPNSKLYSLPTSKLLITNHSLGVTDNYPERGFDLFYKNLENYLEKGKPLTIVDKKNKY